MSRSNGILRSLLGMGRRLATTPRARQRAALLAFAILGPACGGGGGGGSVTPPPQFAILTVSLPAATANVAYSATLSAQGGVAPYVWSLLSGNLPAGMSFDPSTGTIAGTAATNGSSSFVVRLTDGANNSAVRSLTLTVSGGAGGGLAISTVTLPSGTQGAVYSGALSASGGTPPYTWQKTLGVLPAGLTLTGSTGAITGTPTAATGGAVAITFQVTDSLSATVSASVQITINGVPSITTTVLPAGEVGVAYNQVLGTSGGTAPFTFSVTSGALPGASRSTARRARSAARRARTGPSSSPPR